MRPTSIFRNGVEQSLLVYAALTYACSAATFLRHRDSFHGVWHAEDLEEQFPSILSSLDLEHPGPVEVQIRTPSEIPSTADITAENWETIKDIFFMLRLPFEVQMAGNPSAKERFLKVLTARTRRKNGRYGPQGGLVSSATNSNGN